MMEVWIYSQEPLVFGQSRSSQGPQPKVIKEVLLLGTRGLRIGRITGHYGIRSIIVTQHAIIGMLLLNR